VAARTALFVGALCLCFFAGASLAALTFPLLTGRVVDEAGVFDATTKTELTNALAALESKTTDQLVVVTLKSLQGTSIEDYGYQLGRAWGIGQKGKNNGLLLIIVPSEHRVRIEVGYGLEGTVTDAIARLIIENSIRPRFKAGDYAGGTKRAVEDLVQVLTGDAAEWQQRALQQVEDNRPSQGIPVIGFVLIAIFVFVYCALSSGFICQIIWSILFSGMGRGGRWSGGGYSGGSFGGGGGGGFSGGGGGFGGGGASGSW
jgi:uncharacterized protein